jgi:hypothetical protein
MDLALARLGAVDRGFKTFIELSEFYRAAEMLAVKLLAWSVLSVTSHDLARGFLNRG